MDAVAGKSVAGGRDRPPGNLYWLHHKGRVAMFSGSLLAIVLLVAGVVILFKTVRVVPQGYEWTVERFGKYTYTMTPGLHFLRSEEHTSELPSLMRISYAVFC